ncbi:MAG: sensor histidine kinase [Magnetococcales bacterium]|nr:sensor histidine kinase [Magnetococcales bacterium]
MNPSLQNRLAIGLAMVLIPVFLGQWLMMSVALKRIHTEYVASRLAHDAEALFAAVQFSPGDPPAPRLLPARISPIYGQPWSGHYYLVQVGEQVFRSRSLWDAELVVPELKSHDEIATHIVQGPRDEPVVTLVRRFHKQDQTITILVAEETGLNDRLVKTTQLWYALIALLAVGVLLVLQREMVKRRLHPLKQARDELQQLEQGAFRTLTTTSVPSELLPFIVEINRLLSILANQLKKSREVSGNFAHNIRTPLTVLLQLTEKSELDSHPELRTRMRQQIQSIGALSGRILKQVRMAGSAQAVPRIDAGAELMILVEMMEQMYAHRSIRLQPCIPSGLWVSMDREDLLELVGNLLDNGCKWAETTVRCTVLREAGLSILVEDDGPGCPEEQFEQILVRGGRADQSKPGYGIGLAVVQEVVTLYHGELILGRSEALGGFQVRVRLEAMRPPVA